MTLEALTPNLSAAARRLIPPSTAANAPRPRTIKQRPGYGNESDGWMAHSTNNGRPLMIVDQQKTRAHRVRLDRDLDIN